MDTVAYIRMPRACRLPQPCLAVTPLRFRCAPLEKPPLRLTADAQSALRRLGPGAFTFACVLAVSASAGAQCLGGQWSPQPASEPSAPLVCRPLSTPPAPSADLFDDLGRGLSDVGSTIAGAATGVVEIIGGAYVDDLDAQANALPPAFTDVILQFMSLEDFPAAFSEDDLLRARILPAGHEGAGVFLTDGHSAVTLDALIIFKDERYAVIMNWNRTWQDVLHGALSPDEDRALFLAIHELVHVRQFREMGRQAFLDAYLPSVLREGDHGAPLEQEAYAIAPRAGSWARDVIAAYAGELLQ
jgi:hypothetical protein